MREALSIAVVQAKGSTTGGCPQEHWRELPCWCQMNLPCSFVQNSHELASRQGSGGASVGR
eukprot:scaffold208825_cov32-Tisochrysis_lutea.AAC.2